MKKIYLKKSFVLIILLLANVAVQTNVSAMNQTDQNDATTSMTNNDSFNLEKELKDDPTELSNIEAIENTNGVSEETSPLLTVKQKENNVEENEPSNLVLEPSKVQKSIVTEEEAHSNEVGDMEASEKDKSNSDEVKESEATEGADVLVTEEGSSSDEYSEENETIEVMAETEEEKVIIDEEEFSPIIGLPSVKEEVEIEYTDENEVEEKVVEKKKPIVPVLNNTEPAKKVISNEDQQPFEMEILPQTSSNTSDFSEIGYLVTLLAAVFIVSSKK